MQRAPISGDMLVKLTLIAAAVGVLIYAVRSARAAVADLNPMGTVSDVLYATADWASTTWESGVVNPASTNNVVYRGVNSVFWPDDSRSLGTWLYDVMNPEPRATQADVRRIDNALGRPTGADVFYTPYGIYGGI